MKDKFGREIDYLRISLTDRCNLRCGYCMPRCGVESIPHSEILTFEEIARIVRIMASLGVRKIRLTGGEPLIRKGIVQAAKMISSTDGIEETVITTNGVLLYDMADELRSAGIKRVNISLDTQNRERFMQLTGSDCLDDVLRGIDKAFDAGLGVKINCVPMIGINDGELADIALLAKDRPIDVRFIELMPIGCADRFRGIPTDEVLSCLKKSFGSYDTLKADSSSPAEYYRFDGFTGRVGTISAISRKFCQSCRRLRLTSDGYLKLCLQYPDGVDLKAPIRGGCTDNELRSIILAAVDNKPYAHSFSEEGVTDSRKMVQIGG